MTCPGFVRLVSLIALASGVAPAAASADWSLGAFLGGVRTESTSLRLRLPAEATDVTLRPVTYDGESFQAPVYYGYRAAWFPAGGWLGVEGEFIHLKVVADTSRTVRVIGQIRGRRIDESQSMSATVDRFSISHGVNLLLVNAVARHGFGGRSGVPRLIALARLGAGGSIPHPESTIGGRSFERYEWGAPSLQVGAGLELRLSDRLSATAEYKLTRTVQDVTIAAGGSGRTPLTTHHLAVGLTAHVGRAGLHYAP